MTKNKPKTLVLDKVNEAVTKRIQFNHASDFLKGWVAELDYDSKTSRIERIAEEFYRICLFGESEETRLKAIDKFFTALDGKTKKENPDIQNNWFLSLKTKENEYGIPKIIEGEAIDNKIKEIVE